MISFRIKRTAFPHEKAWKLSCAKMFCKIFDLRYHFSGFYDFNFDIWTYIYGTISIVCQSIYLTFIERLSLQGQYSTLDLIYMQSFNCLCLFLLADLIWDEVRDAFMFFITSTTIAFWFAFVGLLFVGCLLNFAAFYCTTRNSAVTTTVVGNVKAVLQSVIGYIMGLYLFYDIVPNALNILGIVINLCGCFLYGYVKSKETFPTVKVDLNANRFQT